MKKMAESKELAKVDVNLELKVRIDVNEELKLW